jgi:hypothetical protein
MRPLNYDFAYHVDSTTLADVNYELILEQGVEAAEDPENTIEDLTETPNKSSENFDTPAPNLTQEGKPRTLTPTLFTLQPILFISIYALHS